MFKAVVVVVARREGSRVSRCAVPQQLNSTSNARPNSLPPSLSPPFSFSPSSSLPPLLFIHTNPKLQGDPHTHLAHTHTHLVPIVDSSLNDDDDTDNYLPYVYNIVHASSFYLSWYCRRRYVKGDGSLDIRI